MSLFKTMCQPTGSQFPRYLKRFPHIQYSPDLVPPEYHPISKIIKYVFGKRLSTDQQKKFETALLQSNASEKSV
jgi:hypothetical protein